MNLKLPSEVQQEIGKKAKQLRKQYNLTQPQLANRSGVSLASVKRFEQTGKISLDSLLKIASILDVLEDFETLFNPVQALPKSLDEILKRVKK